MIPVLSLLLDMLIAALLGATIFYAMRLYSSLSSFREHRDDFEHVVAKLVASIGQAEQAMKNLKNAGTQEAQNLDELIHHAREMADELRMVNEASDSMAKRLETLAEKNRMIVEGFDARAPYKVPRTEDVVYSTESKPEKNSREKPGYRTDKVQPPQVDEIRSQAPRVGKEIRPDREQKPVAPPTQYKEDMPSFFIRDREYDNSRPLTEATTSAAPARKGFTDVHEGTKAPDNNPASPVPDSLQSQAERELFMALQKNKRKAASSGGQG